MNNIDYIDYKDGYMIGFYFDPVSGKETGRPWRIHLLNGDKQPFRHGLSLENRFKTKEDAVCYANMIADYFGWKKEEEDE